MLGRCRQHFVADNLSTLAFGDIRDEALGAPQPAGDAPTSSHPAATATAGVAPATAAAAKATPVIAAAAAEATPVAAAAAVGIPHAPLSPAVIVIDDSPPGFSPRAGGRERSS
ncbi:hypothetical protein MRB53_034411 [Persea americana]|uniref:Uncharacterized protein n=1 Tax=Persea americana TaxID=3435 RepID=A0ACC2K1N4_PERAE|nr:hypothetical protein MRB53_034411 [Persea americana]